MRDFFLGKAIGGGGAFEFEALGEFEEVGGGSLGDAGGGDGGAKLVEVAEDVARTSSGGRAQVAVSGRGGGR